MIVPCLCCDPDQAIRLVQKDCISLWIHLQDWDLSMCMTINHKADNIIFSLEGIDC